MQQARYLCNIKKKLTKNHGNNSIHETVLQTDPQQRNQLHPTPQRRHTHPYTRHQTDTSEIKVEAAPNQENCLRERRGAHREEVKSRENSLCAIGIYNNPFYTIQN